MLAELRATGFIGLWKDRDELHDSTAYVQQLRERIQERADITEGAIGLGATLCTFNVKHFRAIVGLSHQQPYPKR